MTKSMDWTPEAVEICTSMWNEGKSGGEIGARLGCSRAAVIGKVHRLNLPTRALGTARRQPPERPPRPKRETPSLPKIKPEAKVIPMRQKKLPPPTPVKQAGSRIDILTIREGMCRWPIGHVGDPDFCFCGHGARHGSSYCEYHSRLAYQSVAERRAETRLHWLNKARGAH